MLKSTLLLVGAALSAAIAGCAQCDTCDDFPAPCTGPNCGYMNHGGGSYTGSPMMSPAGAPSAATGNTSAAPASTSTPSGGNAADSSTAPMPDEKASEKPTNDAKTPPDSTPAADDAKP